jgi:tRNA-guanine family transglycosylase
MMLTLHNLTFYQKLMRDLRTAIKSNRLTEFRAERLAALGGEL